MKVFNGYGRLVTSAKIAIAALTLVSACGIANSRADRVQFDGQYFRTKVKSVDKKATPAEFTVVVNGVASSLDGAREAGRFEATKFCIKNFGSSRIDWNVGPDTEPQNLRIADDQLTLSGKCLRP